MMKSVMAFLAGAAMVAVSAAEIDVNGSFKASKPNQQLPDKWVFNNGPKPVGSHKMVKAGDKNTVVIKGEKGVYGIVYTQKFPVKPGERYVISVNAAGNNVLASVGYQLTTSKTYLFGNYEQAVKLAGKTVNIKRIVLIPAKAKGQTPEFMSVLFLVKSPGEAAFDTFKLEKLEK